ncbi:VOC family protein [Peribacillus muralis]|uniref:VOC family protein n=1 Tax=Peribacillus muralis TaxID=264697 RepID=UPI003672D43F
MSKGLLHHIELYVSDLERTVNFWGWFLEEMGYESFQEWESGKSWRLGGMYIVFVQAKARFLDVPYHRGRVGLNHLAFQASSRQQVDEVTRKLEDRGISVLYADKHPFAGGENHYAVFFEDPDRMKVELVAPCI